MARLGMGGGWGGGRLTRSPPHFGFKSKWDVDIDGGGGGGAWRGNDGGIC